MSVADARSLGPAAVVGDPPPPSDLSEGPADAGWIPVQRVLDALRTLQLAAASGAPLDGSVMAALGKQLHRYVGLLQRPAAAADGAAHLVGRQIVRANLVTAGALMGGGPAGYERAAAFAAGPEGVEALLWLMQGRVPAPLEPPGDCAHIARDIFQTLGRSERTKAAVAAALGRITERARRAEAGEEGDGS